jgi:hypothetical protein
MIVLIPENCWKKNEGAAASRGRDLGDVEGSGE